MYLFYYIQVGYSGQSDIVARKVWPKVATISEMHCTNSCYRGMSLHAGQVKHFLLGQIIIVNVTLERAQ